MPDSVHKQTGAIVNQADDSESSMSSYKSTRVIIEIRVIITLVNVAAGYCITKYIIM